MRILTKFSTKKPFTPEIFRYGSGQILLQSSLRPQISESALSSIKVLKQVAFSKKIVSLSANQIGINQRMFVCLKPQYITPGKWRSYQVEFQQNKLQNPDQAYQAISNPVQLTSSFQQYYAHEQCPSFQGLRFQVKIPIFANIKYITEQNLINFFRSKQTKDKNVLYESIPDSLWTEEKIYGFKGRVWDHQIRHLEGILAIQENVCGGKFQLLDQYKQSIENIEYYKELKNMQDMFSQKNLQKLSKTKKKQLQERQKKPNSNSFINIDNVMIPQQLKNRQSLKQKKMNKPQKKQGRKMQLFSGKKQKTNKKTDTNINNNTNKNASVRNRK